MGDNNTSDIDVVRAWKDEEYRSSLTEAQRAQLPENPAGQDELTDEAIDSVAAGGLGLPNFGRVPTVTAECGCPNSLTGSCKCPI